MTVAAGHGDGGSEALALEWTLVGELDVPGTSIPCWEGCLEHLDVPETTKCAGAGVREQIDVPQTSIPCWDGRLEQIDVPQTSIAPLLPIDSILGRTSPGQTGARRCRSPASSADIGTERYAPSVPSRPAALDSVPPAPPTLHPICP